jgi:thioredoxin reductase (NADPH)
MSDIIDVAIIGAGPAGLSAAVNTLARGKTLRLFSSSENYLAKAERRQPFRIL